MYDNQLVKITRNGKSNIMAFKTLVRKLDINITKEEGHWIKYKT